MVDPILDLNLDLLKADDVQEWDRAAPLILGVARGRIRRIRSELDEAEVMGLAVDVFVEIKQGIDTLPDIRCLRRRVIRCVVNRSVDSLRKKMREGHHSQLEVIEQSEEDSVRYLTSKTLSPAEELEWAERVEAARRSIQVIPPERRKRLRAQYIDELKPRQSDQIQGLPAGTTADLLAEDRRTARDLIKNNREIHADLQEAGVLRK